MNLLHAIILGIVEGLTEFLPVSSTGHLILASHLLGLPQNEFLKSFEIAIQAGAILAVLVLYGRSLLAGAEILKRVAIAFLPTAAVGLLFYPWIKSSLLGNESVVLAALFFGGVFLVGFERFYRERGKTVDEVAEISYGKAFWIGLFQSLAIVPGVSRSAATILGGLALGLKRSVTVEFSFLLAIPTLLGATGLDLLKNGLRFSTDQLAFLAAGGLTSFFVAMFGMRFLLRFIQRHTFTPFGVYRVLAALFFWLVIH